ncbi:MAG: HTTM domain-containing protein [Myxococcales bacterium]|nr:MAG: HTTM domain-containing protein [Myxococcales bacterium]
MSFIKTLDRWWCPVTPPTRLAALRIAVGSFALAYLLVRLNNLNAYAYFPASSFSPVGPVSLLSGPMPAWLVHVNYLFCLITAVPFILGWKYRLLAPCFALAWLWLSTYRNSWQMIFHTENLLTLHVIILAVAPAAASWSLDAKHRALPPADARFGWPIKLMATVVVLAYMLAGVAKLRNCGLDWISGDQLRSQIAYDNLRKLQFGDVYSPLGIWLLRFKWLFGPLAWLSLILELGAPLALLHRKVAQLWCWSIWGFHLGVFFLMAILFTYPVSGVAFLPFFHAEKSVKPVLSFFHKLRASRVPAG